MITKTGSNFQADTAACDSCGANIAPNDGWGLANNGGWYRRHFVLEATIHACSDPCKKKMSDPNTPGKAKTGTWQA